MVKIEFEERADIPDDLVIVATAQNKTMQVGNLISYIQQYENRSPKKMPIKNDDIIQMVGVEEIICAEINDGKLVITTVNGSILVSERLANFKSRLNNIDFFQVSKQSIVNLNHLQKLESSFSGSLTARLTNDTRVNVSRKYVRDLMQVLGV